MIVSTNIIIFEEFVLLKYHKSTIIYNRAQCHYGVTNSDGQYILNRCLFGERKDGLNIHWQTEMNYQRFEQIITGAVIIP